MARDQIPSVRQNSRGLDLSGGDSGLLVVCSQLACLGGDTLEDVVDERVQDRHGTVGDTSVGVDLLEDCFDVSNWMPNENEVAWYYAPNAPLFAMTRQGKHQMESRKETRYDERNDGTDCHKLTLVDVRGVGLLAGLGALLLVTRSSSLLAGILLLGGLGGSSRGLGGSGLLVSGLGRHFGECLDKKR